MTMPKYESNIDVEKISALDMHVHIEMDEQGHKPMPEVFYEASAKYFKAEDRTPSIDKIADTYRELDMATVVFVVAARNEYWLLRFGSVDPRLGEAAIEEAQRQASQLGVRGFKFHPSVQGFDPSDRQFYPLWEALEEIGLPIISHTGQNGMGAGLPGGAGIKLGYSNPLLLDEVAADFPNLPVIMAHPSVPWQDEANSIATHKANVY